MKQKKGPAANEWFAHITGIKARCAAAAECKKTQVQQGEL